jgi:uncharacterized membrane protein HdeD (DUF308 family)
LFFEEHTMAQLELNQQQTVNIDPKAANREKYKLIASNIWWVVMAHGITIMVVGLFLLLQPSFSVSFIAQIAGIYLIVMNTLSIIQWVLGINRNNPHATRTLAINIAGVVIGVIIALVPYLIAELIARFLFLFVGIGLILYGVFYLAQASFARYVDADSSRQFMLGVLWLLVGFLVMIAPLAATRIIISILGIAAVGGGVALAYFSLYLRRLGREIVRQIDVEIEREQILIEPVPDVVPLRPDPE